MLPARVPWTVCAEAHVETSLLPDHSLWIQPVARRRYTDGEDLHTLTHEKSLKDHYVFTEYVQVQHFCRLVICFEFVLAQLDLQPSKAVFQKCIFRSLTSWWMAFQEFLVSVSDRPLLQPISTIVNNTFSRHTRIHILMYTYGHWF